MGKFWTAMVLFLLPACQSMEATSETLINAFDQAMFSYPRPHFLPRPPMDQRQIVRWKQEVRFRLRVEGSPPKGLDAYLRQAMKRAENATGHGMESVDQSADVPANFIFILSKRGYFTVRGERAGCYTRTWTHKSGHIVRAEIFLPGKSLNLLKNCIDHEILHALGFRGHLSGVHSVLNSRAAARQFTRWDLLFLSILYNPALKPGLRRAEGLETAYSLLPPGS